MIVFCNYKMFQIQIIFFFKYWFFLFHFLLNSLSVLQTIFNHLSLTLYHMLQSSDLLFVSSQLLCHLTFGFHKIFFKHYFAWAMGFFSLNFLLWDLSLKIDSHLFKFFEPHQEWESLVPLFLNNIIPIVNDFLG